MPSVSYRYPDELHQKLRIIAATHGESVNTLVKGTMEDMVREWERVNGPVKLLNK